MTVKQLWKPLLLRSLLKTLRNWSTTLIVLEILDFPDFARHQKELKRERFNRRRYVTRAEARSDIFDYIERFYNQRKKRKLTEVNQPTLN